MPTVAAVPCQTIWDCCLQTVTSGVVDPASFCTSRGPSPWASLVRPALVRHEAIRRQCCYRCLLAVLMVTTSAILRSDIRFLLDDGSSAAAHRCILAARCPYFAGTFSAVSARLRVRTVSCGPVTRLSGFASGLGARWNVHQMLPYCYEPKV